MRRVHLWLLAALGACGRTAHHGPDADAPGGAAPEGAAAGTANIGGNLSDDANPLACSSPYAGLQSGPRQDGPLPTMGSCDTLSDDLILERYGNPEGAVPTGLFYELPWPSISWNPSCSPALEATIIGASFDADERVTGSATPWFFEAQICRLGQRVLYRQLDCNYFDGSKFSGTTPEDLAFLGSLLWWQSSAYRDAFLLGYSTQVGDATVRIEMCSLEGVGSELDPCDEIALYGTTHALSHDGHVTLGERQLVRMIKGKCRLTR